MAHGGKQQGQTGAEEPWLRFGDIGRPWLDPHRLRIDSPSSKSRRRVLPVTAQQFC